MQLVIVTLLLLLGLMAKMDTMRDKMDGNQEILDKRKQKLRWLPLRPKSM
jgi:hypothetical protein